LILSILFGLIGLGVIVFIHELGHFSAAKLFGIEVEAFALGWGKKLRGFTRKGTEYRINVLPIGGYCRMKGEDDFRQALAEKQDSFPKTPGSLFSVKAYKRLLTYAAGPVFNFIFAVLLFSAIWLIGFSQVTYENRILLTSHYPEIFGAADSPSPAEAAGLQDGDRIVSINGSEVKTFADMQEIIAVSPQEEISLTVERDGRTFSAAAVPELNTESGSGYLGITPYIEPEISAVQEDGSVSGLQPGDVLRRVNGVPVRNTLDFYRILQKQPGRLEIEAERSGRTITAVITPMYDENGNFRQPFSFKTVTLRKQEKNIASALGKGVSETVSTLFLTLKSIGLLFRGVDVQSAVAGPVRITYLVGDTASRGFQAGLSQGIITLLNLMAFISIALGFTNLLPIPALDGGQIMVSAYELFKGDMLSPKYYYVLQIIGFSIIAAIFVFALFNDISYLMVR